MRPATSHGIPLEAKVERLGQADAYAEPTARVDRVETHMSWVFLTDEHAYKLKKPVRREFLDFSTIEARRRNCHTEVRLNRRLAPDVYLGVVPLAVDSAGELRVEAEGAVADWLVKMRRLPRERMLDYAIRHHTLTSASLEPVATLLGNFYRACPPARLSAAEFRGRLGEDIDASHDVLGESGYPEFASLAGGARATLQAFLRGHADLFETRVGEGHVVEGHGDLRPEHLYLGPPPAVIDCLEFQRRFRIVDAVDELAFLGLECERLGCAWAEAEFLEHYSALTGDRADAELIAFYKTSRALLRAKLALWHLDEPGSRGREHWLEAVREYLDLAARYVPRGA